MKNHHEVLIIGAGTAGIMVAAQLLKKNAKADIAIIDPAETHYYQPAWTLVGAGTFDFKQTARPMSSVMPKGVTWIKEYATGFEPENNSVSTDKGSYTYDVLVVAPGLVMAPELIEGLPEALERKTAVSNYTDPEEVWRQIKNFKGGNAVFTQPTTPIKCGGAPQKIAYLAADYFEKHGLKDKTNVVFATPGSVIFGVKPIAHTLMEVINRYDIHLKTHYAPIKIDSDNKEITFKSVAPAENMCVINEDNALEERMEGDSTIKMPFDLLHLAPPQQAPKFVRESNLVNDAGWLNVDTGTLQHKYFENIFGLGDVAALPTAKTGAAIRKQVPVVVENIDRILKRNGVSDKIYNGYSSCPLVTGYGKMVLAEFDYTNTFTPDPKLKQMLVFNSDKEHWRLWMLKKYMLPYLYWNKMMKGEQV